MPTPTNGLSDVPFTLLREIRLALFAEADGTATDAQRELLDSPEGKAAAQELNRKVRPTLDRALDQPEIWEPKARPYVRRLRAARDLPPPMRQRETDRILSDAGVSRSGRAPRPSANARTRGSRRGAARASGSRASPDDPGDDDDPAGPGAKADRETERRSCRACGADISHRVTPGPGRPPIYCAAPDAPDGRTIGPTRCRVVRDRERQRRKLHKALAKPGHGRAPRGFLVVPGPRLLPADEYGAATDVVVLAEHDDMAILGPNIYLDAEGEPPAPKLVTLSALARGLGITRAKVVHDCQLLQIPYNGVVDASLFEAAREAREQLRAGAA